MPRSIVTSNTVCHTTNAVRAVSHTHRHLTTWRWPVVAESAAISHNQDGDVVALGRPHGELAHASDQPVAQRGGRCVPVGLEEGQHPIVAVLVPADILGLRGA